MATTSLSTADRGALSLRLLPPGEWDRLALVEPFATRGLPDDPASWAILVVERAGTEPGAPPQIVGTCSLFVAAHWDCWWLDPTEAGGARGVILRQLLRGALQLLTESATGQVYTGAEDDTPEVADLLARFGFRPAAGRLFVLTVADVAAAFTEG